MVSPAKLQEDTRPAQAVRVADFLEKPPASTQMEIDAAYGTCISELRSDMQRAEVCSTGYSLERDWRRISCARGTQFRKVGTTTRLYRPRARFDCSFSDA